MNSIKENESKYLENFRKGRKEAHLRAGVELEIMVCSQRIVLALPLSSTSFYMLEWPPAGQHQPHPQKSRLLSCYLLLQCPFQSIHSQLLLPQAGLVGSLLLLGLASNLGNLSVGPGGTGGSK